MVEKRINKMIPKSNNTIRNKKSAVAAPSQVINEDRDDGLTAERAAYAEIGRIVGIPFSVADVYEKFADQVAKIIRFDLIVISHLDWVLATSRG